MAKPFPWPFCLCGVLGSFLVLADSIIILTDFGELRAINTHAEVQFLENAAHLQPPCIPAL